jgi:hypothetical protein
MSYWPKTTTVVENNDDDVEIDDDLGTARGILILFAASAVLWAVIIWIIQVLV